MLNRVFKTRKLFHINFFFVIVIQEDASDIHLVQDEEVITCKCKQHPDGLKSSHKSKCFFIVNPLLLVIPLCYQSFFVFYDVLIFIQFVHEDTLCR